MIERRPSTILRALIVPACLALACCTARPPAQPSANAAATQGPSSTAPPPAEAPVSTPTLASLKGLTADELRADLGAPTLLRADGPSQLWQYAGAGCVLHVFLGQESGVLRVMHAETRVDDPSTGSPPTCVAWKGRAPAS
jgi:hypothetical protein